VQSGGVCVAQGCVCACVCVCVERCRVECGVLWGRSTPILANISLLRCTADTEGSLVVDRLLEIATHTSTSDSEPAELLLSRIYVYRVHNYLEQLAAINLLPRFLREHPNTRLVVVDSVSFHFRHGFADSSTRNRCLQTIAGALRSVATTFSVAVWQSHSLLSLVCVHLCVYMRVLLCVVYMRVCNGVVLLRHSSSVASACLVLSAVQVVLTNQVTTKFDRTSSRSLLVPALGERWAHISSTRILIAWEGDHRCAHLRKSSFRQPGSGRWGWWTLVLFLQLFFCATCTSTHSLAFSHHPHVTPTTPHHTLTFSPLVRDPTHCSAIRGVG
jgi:Rad51